MSTIHVLNVTAVSIFPGDSWNPSRPEYDIIKLAFKCWTPQGQLVHASPNGKIYYIHHGLALLFPINLQYSTLFPVYWVENNNKRIPFLAAENDFQPRFGGLSVELTMENCYPVNPVLQVMGPALDLHLFGGLSDQFSADAQLQAHALAVLTAPRTSKAVNAFIAYRCLYGPYIPLVRQMEISGIIRNMWANENIASKAKFSIAAKVYTMERDRSDLAGLPRVSLKQWLYTNCGRFQINAPEFHIIPHLIYTVEEANIVGYRQWIMDSDMFLHTNYPSWAAAPSAIEVFAQRDYDLVALGDEQVLNGYYSSNFHFQQFDFQLAFAAANIFPAFNNPVVNNPAVVNIPANNAAVINPVAIIAPPANNHVVVNNPPANNAVATNP
ncbi:hypothetical protein EV426DRAFT_578809 [Tirmania nivea]|nr:hypothetical protein EV426DRAFT_578809 [Tirmania nivea]